MKFRKMIGILPVLLWMQTTLFAQVTAHSFEERIEIRINGNLFTNYVLSPREKYPFFFPVNGPSKASVTSLRNANYPHHSSLFFGCDRLNGGNYWQAGLERGQIVPLWAEVTESGGDRVIIENENIWKRPGAMAPVKDFRIITLSAPSETLYQIDMEIYLEMLQDVIIQKTNHSLFSARMDPDLSVVNGGTMINAQGNLSEKNTFGKPSPWIDYYGSRMGKKEGLAIFQHPTSYGFPSPWFTRDYGFISPTPMFWPENGETTVFSKGEVILLRYRVVIHSGDHLQAGIRELYEKYRVIQFPPRE